MSAGPARRVRRSEDAAAARPAAAEPARRIPMAAGAAPSSVRRPPITVGITYPVMSCCWRRRCGPPRDGAAAKWSNVDRNQNRDAEAAGAAAARRKNR